MAHASRIDFAESDDPTALARLVDDESAWKNATAQSKVGKEVGAIFVTPGRGPKRRLGRPFPAAVTAQATAGMTRIAIIYNGQVHGRPEWELADEVRHFDAELGATLIAPKGYKFDLASIPRPLWSLIAPFELSTLAPLFHDLIYEFKGNLPSDNVAPFPARHFFQKDADDLFLRLMVLEGIPWMKRNAAYVAVRAAGWTYWNA